MARSLEDGRVLTRISRIEFRPDYTAQATVTFWTKLPQKPEIEIGRLTVDFQAAGGDDMIMATARAAILDALEDALKHARAQTAGRTGSA